MKTTTVSPRDGVSVRHPATGRAIAPKTTIELTPQIRRYIKDGDLIEVKKATAKKESK